MDRQFRTDFCSVVADLDMKVCCLVHDWAYWQGGTWRDRAEADREYYQCIKRSSKYKFLAGIRWFGVRVGGVGWLPFEKWRWGYGWNYPRTKAPDPDNSTETVEKNKAEFEKKLKEAQQEKAKMHAA